MIDLNNPVLKYWKDGKTDCWAVTDEYKHELILDYAERYNLDTFYETGTYLGDTVEAVRSYFRLVYSIEISKELFDKAAARFQNSRDIFLLHGDSQNILPYLVFTQNDKALFWIDAHGSGGDTEDSGSPLEAELTAILDNRTEGVILIDDLQDFWQHDWAETARRVLTKYPDWTEETKFGIMRITR